MKQVFSRLIASTFLAFFLSSCTDKGYDSNLMKKAIKAFDSELQGVNRSKNSAIRFISIAEDIDTFPDSNQSIEQYCKEGLIRNYAHLITWRDRNIPDLNRLSEILAFEDYVLTYANIQIEKRQVKLQLVGQLLMVDALLKEKDNSPSEALEALIKVYRYSSLLASDAFINDYAQSWTLHKKANALLKRLILTLDKKGLEKIIIVLEKHCEQVSSLKNYMKRKKQYVPIMIQQYLKPETKDGYFTRLSLPHAEELEAECDNIFKIQNQLISKNDRLSRLDKSVWQESNAALESLLASDRFYALFFGYFDKKKTSHLQTVNYYISIMILHDEIRQLQGMWLIQNKTKMPNQINFNHLKAELSALHRRHKTSQRNNKFKDPFTKKDFSYRVDKYESLIWSIGPDKIDTQGLFEYKEKDGSGDIVIRLKHKKATP